MLILLTRSPRSPVIAAAEGTGCNISIASACQPVCSKFNRNKCVGPLVSTRPSSFLGENESAARIASLNAYKDAVCITDESQT